jgi:hypothetical protein
MEKKKRLYYALGGFVLGLLTASLIWLHIRPRTNTDIPAGSGGNHADNKKGDPGGLPQSTTNPNQDIAPPENQTENTGAPDMGKTPDKNTEPPATDTPKAPASSAKAWDKTAVYTGGDIVSYEGCQYRAKWWTQGEKPDSSDVWEDLGIVDGEPATPAGTENAPIDANICIW